MALCSRIISNTSKSGLNLLNSGRFSCEIIQKRNRVRMFKYEHKRGIPPHFNKLFMPRITDLNNIKKGQIEKGDYVITRRSEFVEWNYIKERYAFCRRLGEDIDDELLKEVFSGECDPAKMEKGFQLIQDFCSKYLRHFWPDLPEEGIQAAVDYLSSESNLEYIAQGIGMKDLIFSDEYPPFKESYVNAFLAFIHALWSSNGQERVDLFTRDFVVPSLVGKNLWDFWQLEDPYSVLQDILKNSGRGEAIPRIIGQLGPFTLEAVHRVGIYSDKELLGIGEEANLQDAKLIASYDSLSRFFNITPSSEPLNFSLLPENISSKTENPPLNEWNLHLKSC